MSRLVVVLGLVFPYLVSFFKIKDNVNRLHI